MFNFLFETGLLFFPIVFAFIVLFIILKEIKSRTKNSIMLKLIKVIQAVIVFPIYLFGMLAFDDVDSIHALVDKIEGTDANGNRQDV